MEPNNPTPPKEPENTSNDQVRPTYSDLHEEGVDIVTGSGISEDNEFANANAETVVPEPSPVTPPIEPVPTAEPVVPRTPEPEATRPNPFYSSKPIRPTPPPAPAPKPVVEEKVEPINDPSIKPLRTFKSDAEEAVKYQNVSTIDIVLAEQRRREAEGKIKDQSEKKSNPGIFVLFAIVVILLIGGGWYYWFISSQDSVEKTPVPTTVKTIVPFAKGSTIYLDPQSDPMVLIAAKLGAANSTLGSVYTLVTTRTSTSTDLAPVSKIFARTKIPSRLERSLVSNQYMIATYIYDANNPFIILKNSFFQNAFSGMLEWEKDIRKDLLPLIKVTHVNEPDFATTTAFMDAVVSNIDARVLKNDKDEVILVYAFADKDTIVISTNLISMKYVLDRLLTVRTIQ